MHTHNSNLGDVQTIGEGGESLLHNGEMPAQQQIIIRVKTTQNLKGLNNE